MAKEGDATYRYVEGKESNCTPDALSIFTQKTIEDAKNYLYAGKIDAAEKLLLNLNDPNNEEVADIVSVIQKIKIKQNRKTTDWLLRLACSDLKNGNLDKAKKAAERLLFFNPHNEDVIRFHGNVKSAKRTSTKCATELKDLAMGVFYKGFIKDAETFLGTIDKWYPNEAVVVDALEIVRESNAVLNKATIKKKTGDDWLANRILGKFYNGEILEAQKDLQIYNYKGNTEAYQRVSHKITTVLNGSDSRTCSSAFVKSLLNIAKEDFYRGDIEEAYTFLTYICDRFPSEGEFKRLLQEVKIVKNVLYECKVHSYSQFESETENKLKPVFSKLYSGNLNDAENQLSELIISCLYSEKIKTALYTVQAIKKIRETTAKEFQYVNKMLHNPNICKSEIEPRQDAVDSETSGAASGVINRTEPRLSNLIHKYQTMSIKYSEDNFEINNLHENYIADITESKCKRNSINELEYRPEQPLDNHHKTNPKNRVNSNTHDVMFPSSQFIDWADGKGNYDYRLTSLAKDNASVAPKESKTTMEPKELIDRADAEKMAQNSFLMLAKILTMELQFALDSRNNPFITWKNELNCETVKYYQSLVEKNISEARRLFQDGCLDRARRILTFAESKYDSLVDLLTKDKVVKLEEKRRPKNQDIKTQCHVPCPRKEKSAKGTMEDAGQCIKVAKHALANKNYEKAEKFLLKAERIFPSTTAKKMLIDLKEAKDKLTATVFDDLTTSGKKIFCESTVDEIFDKKFSSERKPDNIVVVLEKETKAIPENPTISKSFDGKVTSVPQAEIEKCIQIAQEAYEAGDYEEAEKALKSTELKDPNIITNVIVKQLRARLASRSSSLNMPIDGSSTPSSHQKTLTPINNKSSKHTEHIKHSRCEVSTSNKFSREKQLMSNNPNDPNKINSNHNENHKTNTLNENKCINPTFKDMQTNKNIYKKISTEPNLNIIKPDETIDNTKRKDALTFINEARPTYSCGDMSKTTRLLTKTERIFPTEEETKSAMKNCALEWYELALAAYNEEKYEKAKFYANEAYIMNHVDHKIIQLKADISEKIQLKLNLDRILKPNQLANSSTKYHETIENARKKDASTFVQNTCEKYSYDHKAEAESSDQGSRNQILKQTNNESSKYIEHTTHAMSDENMSENKGIKKTSTQTKLNINSLEPMDISRKNDASIFVQKARLNYARGNLAEAKRLLIKAERIFPTEDTESFLEVVETKIATEKVELALGAIKLNDDKTMLSIDNNKEKTQPKVNEEKVSIEEELTNAQKHSESKNVSQSTEGIKNQCTSSKGSGGDNITGEQQSSTKNYSKNDKDINSKAEPEEIEIIEKIKSKMGEEKFEEAEKLLIENVSKYDSIGIRQLLVDILKKRHRFQPERKSNKSKRKQPARATKNRYEDKSLQTMEYVENGERAFVAGERKKAKRMLNNAAKFGDAMPEYSKQLLRHLNESKSFWEIFFHMSPFNK